MMFEYRVIVKDGNEEKKFYGIVCGEDMGAAMNELLEFYYHYDIQNVILDDMATCVISMTHQAILDQVRKNMEVK